MRVTDEAGAAITGVEVHTFLTGSARILGLHTIPQLRVDELGPPDFKSNERFEKPRQSSVTLPREMHAVDIRAGKALGAIRQRTGTLDPYEPALLALSDAPFPRLHVVAPATAARGHTAVAPIGGARPVLRVDVADPEGKFVAHYSGNVLAMEGRAAHAAPLAMNDAPGKWRVTVTDLVTGQRQTSEIGITE
ncbi:MAG: hypothetical protein ACRD44_13890 [Bryobacteraceae bacterium]